MHDCALVARGRAAGRAEAYADAIVGALRAELAAARDALGAAWTQSGATLAEGIVAKTKFLERLGAFEFHPRSKWHEDIGDVVWWRLPVAAPPYVGTPGDSGWVDVYTHFSRLPSNDEIESAETAAGVTRG